MARFEIPKEKVKSNPRKTKAPVIEQQSEKSDDEKQQKYLDLEQRVKEAEPGKNTKRAADEKDEAGVAAANKEAKAEEDEGKAKADASAAPAAAAAADEGTEQRCTAAPEGNAASEAEGRNEKDERIRALVQERKTIAKDKKDLIREISKEIKKCIRDNKRLKRRKNPKKSGKSQRHKKYHQHQICEKAYPHPQSQKQGRRSSQDETRNCQCFLRSSTKTCMKAKMTTSVKTL